MPALWVSEFGDSVCECAITSSPPSLLILLPIDFRVLTFYFFYQAGQIQERGCQYVFKVTNKSDLNRQLVKSETCTSSFPELSLEIPAQRGHLTTIEGLLTNVLEDLSSDQPVRQHTDPENYQKIEAFCDRIRNTLAGGGGVFPFHLKLNDPAGNSWVEPQPGDPRGKWVRTDYVRTREQNEALALTDTGDSGVERTTEGGGKDFRHTEVHTFPATCPSCVRPCNTYMKFVEIPHFKEVVLMSTVCDDCGCMFSPSPPLPLPIIKNSISATNFP